MMNPIGPGGSRPNVRSSSGLKTPVSCFSAAKPAVLLGFFFFFISQFPMGPGPDGPMGGMGGMEQHHMNGSLGESSEMNSDSFFSACSWPSLLSSVAQTQTYCY